VVQVTTRMLFSGYQSWSRLFIDLKIGMYIFQISIIDLKINGSCITKENWEISVNIREQENIACF